MFVVFLEADLKEKETKRQTKCCDLEGRALCGFVVMVQVRASLKEPHSISLQF